MRPNSAAKGCERATYQAREETGLKDTQKETDYDHAGIVVNATESHGQLPKVSPIGVCGHAVRYVRPPRRT